MIVLGIESSCDETGLAIYDSSCNQLHHELHSQIPAHQEFGGVVPELASRNHIQHITPVLQNLLKQQNLKLSSIDAIAYTKGPGLVGSLLVGASFAKSLAVGLNKPVLGIHHMEAHLLIPLFDKQISFPFLALLVSGGHTLLALVGGIGNYQVLGESLDDAVGEAFDKTAKLLGLPYPGGPNLEQLAKHGAANRFEFARPLAKKPGLNFSFSGLKTQVLNTVKALKLTEQDKSDVAYAFQQAAIDSLVTKCKRALSQFKSQDLVIAGGVSANQYLRQQFTLLSKQLKCNVHYPRLEYCTDNGAMVAYTGYLRLSRGESDLDLAINVRPRWPISELKPIQGSQEYNQ